MLSERKLLLDVTDDSDTVVVNVCLLVKLLLDLGVLTLGPGHIVSLALVMKEQDNVKLDSTEHILDTSRVKGSLVDAVGNHFE